MPGPLLFLLVIVGSIAAVIGALLVIGVAFAGVASLFSSGGKPAVGGGSSASRPDPFGPGGGCGDGSCDASCGDGGGCGCGG
ncbi:hypothetical protein GCM10009678_19490 [Actinomadura kijaniata]|uniref:Uncharacterized protein n=1 Tax=Actinomadura namibiensis TaxID=182080 RepID=A0A7W3LXL5_ACTNM|nr:hypothetical protein [Actinomadura namibiensis]MBA8956193.1 hypothetical protein [Actinomadura namibiensis]